MDSESRRSLARDTRDPLQRHPHPPERPLVEQPARFVRLRPVLDSLARPRADAKTHPYGVPVILR